MATTVRITVLTGPHKNRRFCFRAPACCTVGRADDCFIQLSGDGRDRTISRHHCQLDIDPPCVQVRDLLSLNGTYYNGERLEPPDEFADAAALLARAVATVDDGDIITVGGTSLQIHIVDCPLAGRETGSNSPGWAEGEAAKRDCPIPC